MRIFTIFVIVFTVATLLPSSNANPLHVVVLRESDGGVASQRRILMSNGNVLLNFTNDDTHPMKLCEMSQDAAAIRRLLLDRYNRNADVMNQRHSIDDHDGSKFAEYKRACVQSKKGSWAIYPGTKWCGKGNDAKDYDDLGIAQNSDKCCRAHDLCPKSISAFTTKYHYYNMGFITLSHCSCDEKLFNCLKRVGAEHPEEASTSYGIGEMYFDWLENPCFVLERKQYCAKYATGLHLYCKEHATGDVATVSHHLEDQWDIVNNTEFIPGKPAE